MVLIMTMTPLHLTDARPRAGHRRARDQRPRRRDVRARPDLRLDHPAPRARSRRSSSGRACSSPRRCSPALAPPERDEILFVALFLLGWGWNLGFVAGSAMLASEIELAERARVQGTADAVIWTTSAVASLGSGAVVAAAGFSTLGFLGVAIVLAPVWLLLNRRRAIAAGTA